MLSSGKRMITRLMIYVISFVLLSTCVLGNSTTINRTYYYNTSQLPINDNVVYTFLARNNSLINITADFIDDNLTQFYYPNTLLVLGEQNETLVNVTIDYNIYTITNTTLLQYPFIVTTNVSNSSTTINVLFNITDDSIEEDITERYFIASGSVLNRHIVVYDVYLPENVTIQYVNLHANNGTRINVSCGDYMSCAEYVIVGADNYTTYMAYLIVPNGTALGTYNSYVEFRANNKTVLSNVSFEVQHRDEIIQKIEYYSSLQACADLTDEAYVECMLSNYQKASTLSLEAYWELQKNYTCPECICEKDKEFVVVGEADEQCRVAIGNVENLMQENSELRTRVTNLVNEKIELESQIESVQEEADNKIFEDTKLLLKKESQLNDEKWQFQQDTKRTIRNISLGVVGLIIFVAVALYAVKVIKGYGDTT